MREGLLWSLLFLVEGPVPGEGRFARAGVMDLNNGVHKPQAGAPHGEIKPPVAGSVDDHLTDRQVHSQKGAHQRKQNGSGQGPESNKPGGINDEVEDPFDSRKGIAQDDYGKRLVHFSLG